MPRARTAATERIELRTTSDAKAQLVRAANLEQMDLTSFILNRALPAAQAVIAREEQIMLSRRDAEFVLKLLDNPPPPSPEMIEAAQRLRRNRKP